MEIKLCYFNGHWNIYLYGKEVDLKQKTTRTSTDSRGEYRLREYKHPEALLYSFGYMASNPQDRPGHGGEWSSNSKHINQVFGTTLLEIAFNQMSMAAPIEWLKEIMGDQVTWIEDDIYGYKISEVKGQNNVWYQWVTLENKGVLAFAD